MQLTDKKLQMLRELALEKSDTAKLNILAGSIGILHAELKKVTCNYYLDFKKICTPEQQQKLEELFRGIFEGDMPAPGPGRGRQGGRGFGMRNGNNY